MKCLKLDQVSIFQMFDSYLGITKHIKIIGVVKVRVMEYKKREEIHHGGSPTEGNYSQQTPPKFEYISDQIFPSIFLSRFFRSENVKKPTATKRLMVGSFSGRV